MTIATRLRFSLITMILASAFSLPVLSAETVPEQQQKLTVIPVGSQLQELRETLELPAQNQTMDQVLQILGDPVKVFTVGNPKITRWDYGNMTVYFERDRVLRTVIDKSEVAPTAVAIKQ